MGSDNHQLDPQILGNPGETTKNTKWTLYLL